MPVPRNACNCAASNASSSRLYNRARFMATPRDRRRSERTPTASIPVQLSDVNGELIDLSLTGAAVIHRSPVKAGAAATLIFPSYGGIYIPCEVLRSIVQVRRLETDKDPEYVFRSAIIFSPL